MPAFQEAVNPLHQPSCFVIFVAAVHTTVQDLLPSGAYFRFNPYLSERITLDENRAEKLDQLKQDAQMYLRRNSEKFSSAVESLSRRRGRIQRFQDWLRLQVSIKW